MNSKFKFKKSQINHRSMNSNETFALPSWPERFWDRKFTRKNFSLNSFEKDNRKPKLSKKVFGRARCSKNVFQVASIIEVQFSLCLDFKLRRISNGNRNRFQIRTFELNVPLWFALQKPFKHSGQMRSVPGLSVEFFGTTKTATRTSSKFPLWSAWKRRGTGDALLFDSIYCRLYSVEAKRCGEGKEEI